MRAAVVEIIFKNDEGEQLTWHGRIATIVQEQGAEFLVTENGPRIRLDYLLAVNDIKSSDYC